MPDGLYLDDKKKATLDNNVKLMFSKGASKEEVLAMSQDFMQKFGVKKKDNTVSTSANGSSGFQNPLLEVGKNVFNQPPAKTSPKPNPPANIPVKEDDFSYGDVQPEPLKVKPFIKEKPIVKPTPAVTKIQDLQNRTKKISPELVGKEEEFVVPELNYQFKEHGFKFEQTGVGDAMKVIAPNGKETTINLDPLLSKWEVLESDKLKKFISDNSIKYDKVDKVASQQSAYNKRIIDEKEIEATNQRFNDEIKSFEYEVQQLNLLEPGAPEYTKKQNELVAAQNKLQSNQKELERSIGKYVEMKASQGTFGGYLRNQLIEGIAEGASGIAGLAIDAYSFANNIPDATQKAMKKEALPALRGSLDYLKDDTTKEYDAGFVGGAVGGLVKSLPAILAAEGMPLVMAGQISDGLDQEMESNPDFENISELEKLGVKTPMIIGGAILEKYGLRNALESKGLLNDVVLKAIGQSTKNTTVKSFGELIEQDVENRIAKGALKIGAGGLAEFETGASQELLDITTKEIYNASKEKEMFQTPDNFGEGLKQVAKAGLQEAIGGLILSTPSAISAAYKKGNFTKVDDVQIGVFQAVANDPTVLNAIDTDLKMKVNSGDLTPEEAEGQLNDFRQAVGVLNSIETEGLEPEQVKEKMGLAKKVKELEIKKEGKIPSDKKIIQTKIDALNEKLITIGTTKKEQDALTKDEEGLKKSREKEKINKDEKAKTTPQAKQTETIRETDVLKESPAVEQSAAVEEPFDAAFEFKKLGTNMYNFDNPIAEKEIDGVSYRITDENKRNEEGKKIYTLYKDKEPVGEFGTVQEAKDAVSNVSKIPEKIDTKTERVEKIKSTFDSNIESLVHPKTGLAAVVKEIIDKIRPYQDAFLKTKGLTYDDYKALEKPEKEKLDEQWRESEEYQEASKLKPESNEGIEYHTEKSTKGEDFYGATVNYNDKSVFIPLGTFGKTDIKAKAEKVLQQLKNDTYKSGTSLHDHIGRKTLAWAARNAKESTTAKELSKKRIADAKKAFIKASKNPTSGGLYALPEFIELVQAYIADGVLTAKEFIKRLREDNPTLDFDDKEAEKVFNREAGIEEKSEKSGGEVKKTSTTKELDNLINNVPETGAVDEYLSKGTIEKYTGETPSNSQKRGVQKLTIALEHGEKIVAEAKNIFGENYVEKLVEYLENSTAPVSNKALVYVSLENSLGREKLNNPEQANELSKLQSFVYEKSQLLGREYSKSLNYQRLRKFAETGYDLSLITDEFFSSEELEGKKIIEEAVQSDIDKINKEAVDLEFSILPEDIQRLIEEGVQKEIAEIHEGLTPSKKAYAKRAIKALSEVQKKLRSKTYDATIGIPVAIIDSGIEVIKKALDLGYTIGQAVEAGISAIKKKIGNRKWEKENEFRQDALNEFSKRMPDTRSIVKEALINKGFGRAVNIKGVEKTILDWKKLAGAAGTVEQIKRNVENALKDEGKSQAEIDSISNDLLEEYQTLRESIIQKAQTELAKRNRTTVTPKQRSAAKKLAELYNFGLFDKNSDEFETAVIKAVGAKVSEEGFNDAKKIARAMETLYASTFKGVFLNDVSAKAALENLENKLRILLYRESRKQGNGFLRAANLTRNYLEIQQTMILNNLKQAVENPFSGLQQNIIEKISNTGKSTKEMAAQRRLLMKSVFKDMVLNGAIGFGKVETTFVNRQHLDDYVNKVSDNKLYHAIMSVATGKLTLNAMDSLFKASITEKKFTSNLLRILTDQSNPQRMGKEDALKFVSEKLTGQTFEEAKKTATAVTQKINADAGKELMPNNDEALNRLANDIVKSALEMGGIITSEQIEAAYNAAYKSAGLGLGHEANNPISAMFQGHAVKIEGKINQALKEKNWNKAALLTFQSAIWRNVINPFVAGGTNWVVLKFEKLGGGLFTGLGYQIGSLSSSRIDLSSKAGLAKLEKRLYEQSRYKDAYMRGLLGGAVTLSGYLLYLSADDEEEYRKWSKKNYWASRYLNTLIPESILADIAIKEGKQKRYIATLINKNDAFDVSTKLLKAADYSAKGKKEKAWGALGEAVGGKINAPVPWRLVKDGQVIYQGVKGEDPYHGDYKPSVGFLSGVLQGGVIEWLGYRPMPPPENTKNSEGFK